MIDAGRWLHHFFYTPQQEIALYKHLCPKKIFACIGLVAGLQYTAAAQEANTAGKLNDALRRHCVLCRGGLAAAYDTSLLRLAGQEAAPSYHKGHTALQQGRYNTAYRAAQRTIASMQQPAKRAGYPAALFLWAKTNGLKGLTAPAIRQYHQFLALAATGPVLRGDAYASLALLYLQTGDWNKAGSLLTIWQQQYRASTDAATAAALFNGITSLFHSAQALPPPAFVQKSIGLFSSGKDTARWVQLYHGLAKHADEEAAAIYLNKGLALAVASNNYKAQKTFYEQLSILEKKKGRYALAAHYHKAYEAAASSLYQSGALPEAYRMQKEKLLQLITNNSVKQEQAAFAGTAASGTLRWVVLLLAAPVLLFIPLRKLKVLKGEVKQLKADNNTKNDLLAIIAHDLRSAVHALQINIGKIKTALEKMLVSDALALTKNSERMATSAQSLLNNLLYWSLSQSGQISYQPEPVALQLLISAVCYDFLPIAEAKNVGLNYTLQEDLVCYCDVATTKIILRNLIDNAIKYTPAGGAVFVAAQQSGSLCAVTVQDTGIGMPPLVVAALVTGSGSRIQQDTTGRRSTGIGLKLVKDLAEQNGGALHVASEEGVGTTITITLRLNTALIPTC